MFLGCSDLLDDFKHAFSNCFLEVFRYQIFHLEIRKFSDVVITVRGIALHCTKTMVSRMALVLWVLESRSVIWLYEQPMTSLLWEHPRQQQFLKRCLVYKAFCWMGSFGAPSPKGTCLWSSSPCSSFSLPLPKKQWSQDLVHKKIRPDGTIQVSGSKGLKSSQVYPSQFGYATVAFWKEAWKRVRNGQEEVPQIQAPTSPGKFDPWTDAKLTGVMQYLSLGAFK